MHILLLYILPARKKETRFAKINVFNRNVWIEMIQKCRPVDEFLSNIYMYSAILVLLTAIKLQARHVCNIVCLHTFLLFCKKERILI